MKPAAMLFTLLAATAAADRDDRVLEGKAPAADARRLVLEAGIGEVRVEVGADDAVTWRLALEADPDRPGIFSRKRRTEDVRADLAKVAVEPHARGERLELALVVPAGLDEDDFKQRWTVTVPTRFAADLDLDVGEMSVRGLAGGVEAAVDVGELDIDVPGGAIDASVDVGDIELRSGDQGGGDISLEADVGDVDLELGGRRIRTDGGYGPGASIRLEGRAGPRIRLSVDVGDIEARIGR